MRNLLFLILFTAMFVCCKSDPSEAPLVTEVSFSPASGTVAPGDPVAFTAQGLEADDDLLLRVSWPLVGEAIPEGFADGIRGVITARTATGVTFLAPGGWPAGRLDVKLKRGGKFMLLGSLSIADGQPPKKHLLYSLAHLDTDETIIRRIDAVSGTQTDVKTLGVAERIRCAVNASGSNIIQGLAPDGCTGFYDLTMHYSAVAPAQEFVAAGTLFGKSVGFFRYSEGLIRVFGSPVTRENSPPPHAYAWTLPEGIQPEMLSAYPFVSVNPVSVLFSVRRAAGTYAPMVLSLDSRSEAVLKGNDVLADAMVPVQIVEPQKNGTSLFTAGFIVSNGGKAELRLLQPQMTLGEPETVPEISGTVCSVASCMTGETSQDIYLLCDKGAKKQICVLSLPAKTLRMIPGEFLCDEIVLAR